MGLLLATFANLLNTNVGQPSMAESGLRYLPQAAVAIARRLQESPLPVAINPQYALSRGVDTKH